MNKKHCFSLIDNDEGNAHHLVLAMLTLKAGLQNISFWFFLQLAIPYINKLIDIGLSGFVKVFYDFKVIFNSV
jgi:hypothetical protein